MRKEKFLPAVFFESHTRPKREIDTILEESIVFRLIRLPKHLSARQSIR